MESRKVKRPGLSLDVDIRKRPMITTGAIGAAVDSGPAAADGEAARLGLRPTQLPNGRKLWTFEQAETIIRSILKRSDARA